MDPLTTKIHSDLFALQDLPYREFHCKLIPTVDPETVIGIRTPCLRKFAKAFSKQPEARDFLCKLPHKYYEENNLHGFLIEQIKDYDACISALDQFLPYVDNWATCDLINPPVLKQHPAELLEKIQVWTSAPHIYTIRFGIGMLMRYYLDGQFNPSFHDLVAAIVSKEYYVNMMRAWYFATALAKQYEATLPYIEQKRLDVWTHNKTIQKAVESYRISDAQKSYLRKWKRTE